MSGSGKHLLAFGCGYSAQRLAKRLLSEGWTVSGTTRSETGATLLKSARISPLIWDGTAPLAAEAFKGVTHILISVPPGAEGDLCLGQHRAALAASDSLEWVGILSTTGVYGDSGGAWITEDFPPAPLTEANERRLEMEQGWLAFRADHDIAVQVFRLPGIYGPERSPFARLRAGTARRIIKEGQVFNRVHVDDIVQACRLGIVRPNAGPVFHIADGMPAPTDEVLAEAAEIADLPLPEVVEIEEAGLSPIALRFYAECKRLDISRARTQLGFEPIYANYREGLQAIYAEERHGAFVVQG